MATKKTVTVSKGFNHPVTTALAPVRQMEQEVSQLSLAAYVAARTEKVEAKRAALEGK